MPALSPGRQLRLSVHDLLSPVPVAGEPARVTVENLLVPGDPVELEGPEADLSGLTAPGLFRVSWPGGSCRLTVVASHLCSIDDILDLGEDGSTPREYGASEDDAFEARAAATELFEHACGRTFQPVADVQETWAARGQRIMLDWPESRLVSSDGAVAQVGDGMARLVRRASEDGPTTIRYVHGAEACPPDVSRSVARLSASRLLPSVVPDRATAQSVDGGGMLRFTVEGVDGATGIPEVDAAINRHRQQRTVIL